MIYLIIFDNGFDDGFDDEFDNGGDSDLDDECITHKLTKDQLDKLKIIKYDKVDQVNLCVIHSSSKSLSPPLSNSSSNPSSNPLSNP